MTKWCLDKSMHLNNAWHVTYHSTSTRHLCTYVCVLWWSLSFPQLCCRQFYANRITHIVRELSKFSEIVVCVWYKPNSMYPIVDWRCTYLWCPLLTADCNVSDLAKCENLKIKWKIVCLNSLVNSTFRSFPSNRFTMTTGQPATEFLPFCPIRRSCAMDQNCPFIPHITSFSVLSSWKNKMKFYSGSWKLSSLSRFFSLLTRRIMTWLLPLRRVIWANDDYDHHNRCTLLWRPGNKNWWQQWTNTLNVHRVIV